jgi:arylsulfatase A-like enzyme
MRLPILLSLITLAASAADKPNVIFIIGDDVGYGDCSCYGATAIKTPNVDRIAKEGLRFTDAHCAASTCTPTRYALMTGQYAFRKKGTAILPGDAALIIPPGSFTLPAVFQKAGYKTAAVGKWHLGLGEGPHKTDFNTHVVPGPHEIGFDYSFIIPATGDRTPCVLMENQNVIALDTSDPISVAYDRKVGTDPTGAENPELLTKLKPSHGHDMTIVNGVSRIGWMTGGKSARWTDEDIADNLAKRAVAFIEENKAKPFFLYFATHDIHVPRMPNARFVGQTKLGPRGDAMIEFDFQVGEVLNTLDKLGIADNTLVIVSSDNGPVLDDGYQDKAVELLGDHKPAGPYRGGKGTIFEGGTRIPFIARWPARIKPGVSDALVSQVDLIPSFAALVGVEVPKGAAPDAINTLPAMLGESKQGRTELIEQSGQQALRSGSWKYVPPGQGVTRNKNTGAENGSAKTGMLFDLANDIAEEHNLVTENPAQAAKMKARLAEIVK